MQQITQVACANTYSDAATLASVFNSSGGYFSVQNNDAFVELQYGQLGQFFWTNEALVPVGNGVLQTGTTGVRFRNATAGAISEVTAALYAEAEPALIITAGGLASPMSQIDGITGVVSATGTVVRGSGYTAANTGAGTYAITFTSALAAAPVVELTSINSQDIFLTADSTINGFSLTTEAPSGTPANAAFHFIAVVPQ